MGQRQEPALPLTLGVIGLIWGVLLGTYLAMRANNLGNPQQLASAVHAALAAVMGAGLSCVFIWTSRRFGSQGTWPRRVVVMLLTAAAVALLQAAADVPLERAFNSVTETNATLFVLNLGFYSCVQVGVGGMLMVVGALDATRFSVERDAQLEVERARAEAAMLRAQVQPHFLFNTLNGVRGLMMSARLDEADGMLARLASLLRESFRADMTSWSNLRDELAIAEHYTSIEEARFGPRLSIRYVVPEALLDEPVPKLCLLPLVEGVVGHATRAAGPVEVLVRAADRGGHLILRAKNSRGEGDEPAAMFRETLARVLALESGARLKVRESHGQCAVTLLLPKRRQADRPGAPATSLQG